MQQTHAETVSGSLCRRRAAGARPRSLFWLVAAATLFFLPERHLILNEIAILGLFALSLDLILGYAGIVSLGHAAFFGLGAYAAGCWRSTASPSRSSGSGRRGDRRRRSSASSRASWSCAAPT